MLEFINADRCKNCHHSSTATFLSHIHGGTAEFPSGRSLLPAANACSGIVVHGCSSLMLWPLNTDHVPTSRMEQPLQAETPITPSVEELIRVSATKPE